MIKPEIGISEKHLQKSITLLSAMLADEMVLYVKTRKFHWNVAGESFMELHLLFKTQYQELEESIDEIAERIGKLGGQSIGTMTEFTALSKLKEYPDKYPNKNGMLKELLEDHESVTVNLRAGIVESTEKNADLGTADFLTGLLEQHETTAWALRRYLS